MIEEPEALSNAPNSPTINIKLMGEISTDFALVADFLKETSYQIRQRGFSAMPVFVMARATHTIPMGARLIGVSEMNNNTWQYHASMIEEFVQRAIVAEEALANFKENYKDPDEFCCLFVIDGDFASFVYIPFPEE